MTGHADQAVEKYCELSGESLSSLRYFAKPCIDDHELAPEEFETVGVLTDVCAGIVLKVLCQVLHQRPDILWSVDALARDVTRWNAACDKRLHRLICYLHHHRECKLCR
eukprot:4209632-Karenia_brevis.AAC.1